MDASFLVNIIDFIFGGRKKQKKLNKFLIRILYVFVTKVSFCEVNIN